MNTTVKQILLGLLVMAMAWTVRADTTFRAHFNDTGSWNIDTNNGDYSSGSSTATVTGTPLWDTGFFPGSSPENKAFHVTNATPKISFPANNGNVPISNPTSSVMTVSFWTKITGNKRCRPVIIRNQGYTDYLMMDYGLNSVGKWTMIFHDDGVSQGYKTFTTDVSAYITNWLYIAATINLADKTIRVLNYDNTGNLVANQTISMSVDSWDVTNGASVVQLNYGQSGTNQIWIDEFTIDDRELSRSEIQVRVDKMVGGSQLDDNDSFTPTHGTPPGPSNTTFRAHFNDNANMGWDINLSNGDFSAGDYTADWSGNPEWATGFFTNAGASTPANRCLSFTNTTGSSYLEFAADDGNVDYTSGTNGGITVGFWIKNTTDSISDFFRIGSGDYVRMDYGQSGGRKVRTIFHDTNYPNVVNGTILTGKIENWVYIAVTVDLTSGTLTQYQYDNTGTMIGTPASMAIPVDDWDVKNAGSYIRLYGGSSIMIDEFSIDNYVMTESQISNRVQRTVVGIEVGGTDKIAPVITLLGNSTTNVLVDSTYVDAGATASDNLDGDITANIVVTNPVNTAVTGTYYVTYNVQDAASNAAIQVTRTVIVEPDTEPPVITLLGNNPENVILDDTYIDAGATATDNHDASITIVTNNSVNTSATGTYYVTYNATDAAGNAATEVKRTVIVDIERSTTLRMHFNDTSSWNVNTANDDFAKGSTNVSTTGTPLWDTGFFPGSSPENKAFHVTNATPKISVIGSDGNVPITNPTSSVITVSFWIKITGNERCRPILIRNGSWSDYWMLDYGQNALGKWTMIFREDSSTYPYNTFATDVSAYITNWMYVVSTVDLGDKTVRVLNYDDAGTLIANETQSISVDSWDLTSGAAVVELNYAQSGTNQVWIDEFTIDNRKLSMSEIQVRVDKMVGGTELSLDDSFGGAENGTPPGPTNRTFLAHFNDNVNRGWDLNTDNGDFYGGSPIAGWHGSPEWTTGFFTNAGVSVPANRCLSFTNNYDDIYYAADDGNVNYTSVTNGGITVGCWVKAPADGYQAFGLFKIGTASDYVKLLYAPGNTGKARVYFYDNGSGSIQQSATDTHSYLPDWVYFALTVDLGNQEVILRQYDVSGNEIASDTFAVTVTDWDAKGSGSTIVLGDYKSSVSRYYIDEFSIDNYIMTGAQISNRVQRMVAGVEVGGTDKIAPAITLLGNSTTNVLVDSTYVDAGATASDNLDGDITANIVVTNPVNTAVTGTYYVTYNVQDAAGNAATQVTRTVIVDPDTEPPVITLLGNNPEYVTIDDTYIDAGATATDNHDASVTIVTNNSVNTSVTGTYYVTYNATDAAGNAATEAKRTVIVDIVRSTTLRMHFNDTSSWNINTANDDFAKGSTNVSVTGAPLWDTGFFPGSSPENKAFYAVGNTPKLNIVGNDGNVPITNPTGSVMTVGFWCKMTGAQKGRPILIRDQGYKNYLMFDFGNYTAGGWSMIFMDYTLDESTQAKTDVFPGINGSAYITNWMYIAAVIDTGKKLAKMYQYDRDGNMVGNPYSQAITIYSWDVTNGNAVVTLNYSAAAGTTNWVEELTIDNRELSQAEIQSRVNKMVGGTQLSLDDSFGAAAPGTPPGPTNTTFLAHFNDNANRGWDLNTDNGDFYGGSSIASWVGNPEWGTGFFTDTGVSVPANRCLSFTNTTGASYLEFAADDGNVDYTSGTSGGITVGFWIKNTTDSISDFFRIGSGDYIRMDYGQSGGRKVRTFFHDTNYPYVVNGTILTGKIENWVYIAVTVDLTSGILTQYQYDNGGTMIGTPASMTIPVDNWDVKNAGSYIRLYGGNSIMIDEFSIDNYVLTESQLARRVINMVKGYELNDTVPPEGTMFKFK